MNQVPDDSRGVLEQLGLMPASDDQSETPFGIPDLRTSEQHLIRPDRDRLFSLPGAGLAKLERGVVRVQGRIGRFRLQPTRQSGEMVWRSELSGIGIGLLDLQVGLPVISHRPFISEPPLVHDLIARCSPVQIAGLHISQPLRLTTRQQDTIRRYKIVILHPDEIPDLQISPRLFLEPGSDGVQDLCRFPVELSVGCVSLDVFFQLFQGAREDDDGEWDDGRPSVRRRDVGDLLDTSWVDVDHSSASLRCSYCDATA